MNCARSQGQISENTLPTTSLSGTKPPPGSPRWQRESQENPRLSPRTHSFPSGHVGTAVAVYGGAALLLALWLRRRDRPSAVGQVLVVLLALVPVFVALSRLYQGAHHLTDVATSAVYGTVLLLVLATALGPSTWMMERFEERWRRRRDQNGF